jgi:branched-chain amino acid transport system permease protein
MQSQWAKILAVVAAVLALALVVPFTSSFVILLVTRALAFSILVMSLDILLGFTGLASLGQAAYLGIGAYVTAVLATKYQFGLGYDFWLVGFWPGRRSRHFSVCSRCVQPACIS